MSDAVYKESSPQATLLPVASENGLAKIPEPTPMYLVRLAVEQGADLDKLAKLMDLQERWEKNEARKAFVVSLAAFKAKPPLLEKNKQVAFNTSKGRVDYRHATLDHVADALAQALSPHGLSFRWQMAQDNGQIRVTCFLQHVLGHGEQVTLEAPADDSGSKNVIQAIGSTVTYLQRYTLLAATGMATTDQDTDGHITNADISEKVEWMESAKDLAELQRLFTSAYKEAVAAKDKNAMNVIIAAKDKRKAELS